MKQDFRGTIWSIGGMGLGLGLMYWLDPRSGRRRRAQMLDKANHAVHEARDAADTIARDLTYRTKGLAAKASSAIHPEGYVDDATLEARVRSQLGRVASHPHAIQVRARNGRVELKGSIPEHELKDVLSCASHVRGVQEIDNDLAVRQSAVGVPELQGTGRTFASWGFLQENWSPTFRLFGATYGIGLALICLPRKSPFLKACGLFGIGLSLRAISNLSVRKLFGIGAPRGAILLHKTIHVQAPIEEVFGFWNAFENFPRFMSHVREVRTNANGMSHWKVDGPGGLALSWDAMVVEHRPLEVIAWRSVEGAAVRNEGRVRFERMPDGSTRLDILMSYLPPAGAIGHAFAKLLGADPKKQMDDDLLRFKSLLEKGKATGRNETVTREALQPGGSRQRFQ